MKFSELCETGVAIPKIRKILKAFFVETVQLIESDSEDDRIVSPLLSIRRKVLNGEEGQEQIRRGVILLKNKKD